MCIFSLCYNVCFNFVFQEGANINKSLTTLGKVISALAEVVSKTKERTSHQFKYLQAKNCMTYDAVLFCNVTMLFEVAVLLLQTLLEKLEYTSFHPDLCINDTLEQRSCQQNNACIIWVT